MRVPPRIICRLFAPIILYTVLFGLERGDTRSSNLHRTGTTQPALFPPTPVKPFLPMTSGRSFLTIKSDSRTRDTYLRDLTKVAHHLPGQVALVAGAESCIYVLIEILGDLFSDNDLAIGRFGRSIARKIVYLAAHTSSEDITSYLSRRFILTL